MFLQVIRQLMGVAHPGDTIEMGLFIEKPTHTSDSASSDTPRQDSTGQSSPIHEHTGPLRCTFHLMHRYASAHSTRSGAGTSEDGSVPNSPPSFRTSPSFKTLILRRLLRHVGASLEEDVPPRSFSAGKTYALTVQFERGSPSVVDPAVGASLEDTVYQGFPDFKISHEPTLEQLSQFAESLKGRKVTLFAHSKGSFAQHLTSYLTAWGLDVTHVSTEPGADTLPEHVEQVPEPTSSPTASREELPSAYLDQSSAPSPSTSRPAVADALSFCLIDDDVAVLRSRLQKARAEQAYPLHLNTRKRPSLANNHRPRSSPQVARVMGLTPSTSALFAPPPVIVHFTSLANFKLVKDVIQSILMPGAGNASRVPEVIVIPKPAGPRRVLTALHTAITKPIVDPFFYPTATSPISPGFPAITPFFNVSGPAKSPGARSATSVRTASDKSARSPKEHTPSSPRGVSETMEYFSDAAARLGASPASGLVIQSPDGQPAGIFFHPKAKGGGRSERTTTPQSERTGTPSDHPGRSRGVSFRRTADEVKSGSSTPEVATTPRRRAAAGTDGDAGADVQPVEGAPSKGKGRLAPHRGESLVTLGPAGSPAGESPAAAGPPLAPPRKPTQPDPLVRHPSDPPPPTSPSRPSPQPGRRLRRPNMDGPSASAPSTLQKKGKPSDTNIVPPISVLIVDDNPINQTILSTFMTKRRIKYDVAKNGEEAVAKWQTGGFHLILMDIQMPVMDGIEATKEIRRMEKYNVLGGFPSTPQSEGQRTPSEASATESRSSTMSTPPYRSSVIIVALTASSLPSDRVAALAAGCNDFLTKPVSLQWLNSKIIEWGSIKALQMWADIRPDVVKSISSGQAVQAQNVARRLHVPEGRLTPTGSRSRSSSIAHRVPFADGAGALARSLLAEKSATPSPPVQDSDESPGAFSNTSGGSEAVPTVVAQDSHDLEVGHAVNGGAPDSAEAPPATDSFFPPAADASAPPDAPKIDSQPGAADAPPATLSFFPPAADASDPVQAPKNDSQPGAQANSSGLSADLAAADVPELKDAAEAADSPTAPSSDERPPAPPPPPEPQ
ncbi:hypothetical protein POSPLADRAFT_1183986 [Postia placenta MAD-698-R-SB12]|uniref:Response regulatory domain-containing protein n=1 Tax=Postia placenta MAD-698-R-SB12 TaxID=670580 RepID=A0A1X6MSU4_9APHY|nr:hypothetical protein POSPLADRAFT_1183986 [Postia placenta MAD-698-R-SB12]OSX59282.1 hypothetical protein POSPLADRAFT_1183986 [Postia placenta MAD-698-R-SB12]